MFNNKDLSVQNKLKTPLFRQTPYERVFAHRNRHVRYRGLKKVQFQVGIRTLTFNLKRVITLGFENINLVPA